MYQAKYYIAGLILLANLSHAQDRVATLRLEFPVDKSIGFLEIIEEENPDLLALESKDSRLLSAVGTVAIKDDCFISLKLGAVSDLSFLNQLPADSIHRLQIRGRDVDQKSLKIITRFLSLRVLEFTGCRFSDDAFRGAGSMSSLQRLSVGGESDEKKQHVKSLATWAASLPNIEYLYAAPSLTAVNIQAFAGHTKLATLNTVIERDQHAIVFKLLKQLPALSELNVSVDKDVSPRALDRISSFSGLASLTLVGAEVDGDLLKELAKCTKLRELSMIVIRPGVGFHAGLGTIQSLHKIVLTTDIWEDGQAERAFFLELPNTLVGLPEIRDLRVFQSLSDPLFDKILARRDTVESLEINEIAPGFEIKRLAKLAEFKSLKTLKLSSVPIDDDDLQILSHMENVEYLSLERTKVTGTGFRHLAGLPNLVRLQIMTDSRSAVPDLTAVADLPHLKRFQLFGFRFQSQDFFPIGKSKSIRWLALSQGHR